MGPINSHNPDDDGDRPLSGDGNEPPASDPIEEISPTLNFDASQSSIADSEPPAVEEHHPTRLGRYRIDALLGSGGFGAVYEGFDESLGRKVAIKVPRDLGSEEEKAEFIREARRLAQLKHEGIVAVYDVGEERQYCFIVTELVSGRTLATHLKQGTFGWAKTAEFIAFLADALEHAHARSIIHRDIKPANIMIRENGRPVLLDFGLALADVESTGPSNEIAGTPAYMAPEQVRGKAHRCDGRTDIYSLGVVLYEMLCGKRAFRAKSSTELFRRIKDDDPQPPRQLAPNIPPALEEICLRAMSKPMAARFTTAGDFAAALRALAEPQEPTVSFAMSPPTDTAVDSQGPSSSIRRRTAAHKRHVTVAVFNFEVQEAEEEAAERDAESQHELTRAFASICEEAVTAFDGSVMQSTGQEIIACFGFPVARENAALRAVLAGQQILRSLETAVHVAQLSETIPLVAWAAIHSGTAVVEGGDEDDEAFSLVGDARTVASRLEPLTEPGSITISGETKLMLKGQVETEDVGERRLRGVSRPIQMHVISGSAEGNQEVEDTAPRDLSPLTGRDTERSLLRERWEYATDGDGQVVQLIGEAGLGKSRLVYELKQELRGRSNARLLEWNCIPFRANSSLFPAIDCFERTLEISTDSSAEARRLRVDSHLKALGLYSEENAAVLASLLSLPTSQGEPAFSPQRLQERTYEFVVDWICRLAADSPLMFIVEDLHWADVSTLSLLEQVIEVVGGEHILALLTFRPEFESPWTGRIQQTQVSLNRLTPRQLREWLQSRGDSFSESVIKKLIQRTDGVPLFVEEFAKVAEETGGSLEGIPLTLQELLLSRLDRMQSDLGLVQLAAALGREFSFDLLREVAVHSEDSAAEEPLGENELEEELARLVEGDVLFRKGRRANTRYVFKHALHRDAAYQSLLRNPRQQFHARIAKTLENRFPEIAASQPELVAHHFTEANAAPKAIEYWLAAGKRAQGRFANLEAIGHFSSGLNLIESTPASTPRDRQELELQIGLAAVTTQAKGWGYPEIESIHRRAKELCERIGQGSPLFHVTWGTWAWRLLRAELDIAANLAGELDRQAGVIGDNGYHMEASFAVECTALFRGEFEKCLEVGTTGADLYDEARCRHHAALTGMNAGCTINSFLGWGLWIAGYPEKALRIGEQGVALGAKLNDPFSHAHAIYHLGCVQQHCRMGEAAVASGEQSIAIGQEQGYGIWVALGMLCKGSGLLLEGEHIDEGVELIENGFSAFRDSGAELSLTHYFGVLAEAHRAAGRLDGALAAVDDGLSLARRSQERFHESNLHRLRGDLLLESNDDATSAEQCYQEAVRIAQRQQAKSWELRATMSLARVWRRQGQNSQAREMLATIYDWYSEGLETPDLVEARELLAEL